MMMTSGQAVKYKGSIDCAMQITKNEGFMSMMKGAGANILSAGAVYWLVLTNSNRFTWSGDWANELKAVSWSARSRRSTNINRIN